MALLEDALRCSSSVVVEVAAVVAVVAIVAVVAAFEVVVVVVSVLPTWPTAAALPGALPLISYWPMLL